MEHLEHATNVELPSALAGKPVAQALLTRFGGLTTLAQASFDELHQVHGVGKSKAVAIKSTFLLALRLSRETAEIPALRLRDAHEAVILGIMLMAHRWRSSRAIRVAGRLVLGTLVVAMFLRWFEQRQVYHPHRRLDADGSVVSPDWEDVFFTTDDGLRLNGWFFPPHTQIPRVARDTPSPGAVLEAQPPISPGLAVLVCHGNGGNVSHRLDLYQVLLDLGLNVLTFDYRGYGRSQGRPNEEGTYRDALAAHAWLVQRGFAPDRIVALGESLGGGVAAELAMRAPLAGLVLQSSFTSVPDLGAELFPFLPVRWLASIQYNTRAKLPQIRVPLLVLHGRADTLIGFHHAERNFAAANHPKLLWEIAGDHNDGPLANARIYRQGWDQFLARLTPRGR